VLRVSAHHPLLSEQMAELAAERRALLHISPEAHIEKGRQLRHLRGIGINGSGVWVREFLDGRALKNRRAVGGLSGVNPDAVSQRRERPGTRDYPGREPARALDDHGVGLEWGALPT
jgi:hypothetical protein